MKGTKIFLKMKKKKEGQKDKNVWFPSPDRPYAYPKKYLDLKVEE